MNVNEPIHCTSFVNVEAYVQTFKVKGEWGKEGVRNIFGRGGLLSGNQYLNLFAQVKDLSF